MITIGIDPHKGSHTATAVDVSEAVVGELRVTVDRRQRARLLEWAARFEPRRWAIEGATGLGALVAQQLVGAGEHVVDVPPKLCARVRLMDTGRIDKTDPNDARSAAIVALRNATLNSVSADSEHRVVLRLLADRYHQLSAQRTRSVCRLHALLCLLIEGGTGRSLSTSRAVKLLAGVAIGDPIIAERVATCRQFVTELEALDRALVDIRARTISAVDASKTTVIDVYGVGPIGAAIILGHSGKVERMLSGGWHHRGRRGCNVGLIDDTGGTGMPPPEDHLGTSVTTWHGIVPSRQLSELVQLSAGAFALHSGGPRAMSATDWRRCG